MRRNHIFMKSMSFFWTYPFLTLGMLEHFLLIYAMDSSKFSSASHPDLIRIQTTYHLTFFANTPFNI